MIHAVGTHSLNGSLSGGIEYVYQDRDHKDEIRAGVTHLRGDPDMLMQLESTMTTKHTYVHTSLSFTNQEAEMLKQNPDVRDAIIDSYIEQMAAGLPSPDRLPYIAVQHDEPDKIHIEFIALRVDLETGKSYQPFVSRFRNDELRFNDWNTCMQKEHGLENPNSLEHQRSAGWSKNLPENVKAIRNEIDRVVNEEIAAGNIACRKDITDLINNTENMKVARQTNSSISICVEGHKHNIRFKGAVYAADFSSPEKLSSIIEERARVDFQAAQDRLETSMRRLAESSHYKYASRTVDVGRDTAGDMRDSVSLSADVDLVQTQGNDRSISDNARQISVGSNSKMRASKQQDMGADQRRSEAVKLPDHQIFNGVQFFPEAGAYYWEGGYGFAQVTKTDLGYSLKHGSKMEWQMSAQLMKEQGYKSVHITCSSQQSMLHALAAHHEAGVKVSTIKLDGQELSRDELKEIHHEYKNRIEASSHRVTEQRSSSEGRTSAELASVSQEDEQRDKLVIRQIDQLEQSCNALSDIIANIESQQQQQHQQESSLELSFEMSR